MNLETVKLSICIPTYNRLDCLLNCLNSIKISNMNSNLNLEVCICDNNSKGTARKLAEEYQKYFKIIYHVNDKNEGVGKNIINSVKLATGEYAWILGNDDLILPETLNKLSNLFNENSIVDFFFINSFAIHSKKILSKKQPFDSNLLAGMKKIKFSEYSQNKQVDFFKLVDHKVSWDYMLGIFLTIFKREMWMFNLSEIDSEKISDSSYYANIYTTFPSLIVSAKTFSKSQAYIQSDPLSVSMIGEREWADLYPFIESIRIPELLDMYRRNGLPLMRYLIQKNYALRKFFPGIIKMLLFQRGKGIQYINFKKNILNNLLYPGIYYYFVYYLFLKLFKIIFHLFRVKKF